MEEVVQDTTIDVKPKYSRRRALKNSSIILLAVLVGYVHYYYVSSLHENYYHFSHLSELERELTLRTEMGFYYSYYKTVVQERPLIAAISRLMYDRLVEYPKEVNAFNRFNVHPEVIIGAMYRYLEPWLNGTRECHVVSRGDLAPPVTSCYGLAEPMLFYLEAIWWLAGLLLAVIFLQGATLSGSVLGGLLSAAQYLSAHESCTRVQRAPNERENIAAPLLYLQGWLLTTQLRNTGSGATGGRGHASAHLQVSLLVVNCVCLLCWQLSQFVLAAQLLALFVLHQLGLVSNKTLAVLLHSHFCGIHMAVLLLQGNHMLQSSVYTSLFLVLAAYSLFFSSFRIKVRTKTDLFVEAWLVVLRIGIVICSTLYLKKFISDILGAEDDTHIWEVLLSKFTNYKTFHTLMYTCLDVFDFLPKSYFISVTKTSLLPLALYGSVCHGLTWISNAYKETNNHFNKTDTNSENSDDNKKRGETSDSEDSGIENNTENLPNRNNKRLDLDELTDKKTESDSEVQSKLVYLVRVLGGQVDVCVAYHLGMCAAFAAMAVLFMRLKLLLTTQLCILSALAVTARPPTWGRVYRVLLWGCVTSLLAAHLHHKMQLLHEQGEFSDLETEELVQWIGRETPPTAAFAGSMPVSAAVLLTTRRPIVSHPHYENKEARERAYSVHKVYGRVSERELHAELTRLHAHYLILETALCYGTTSQGCHMTHIWDAEQPALRTSPQLCDVILSADTDTEHLYRVFRNRRYSVYRVTDLSVRYMPRVFDT